MDAELTALASKAAETIVALLTTQSWDLMAERLTALWRRVRPGGADQVADDLANARNDLLAARDAGENAVEPSLVREWEGRLGRLLATEPWLAAELSRLLQDELRPQLAASEGGVRDVRMRARVDHGNVYQAGRDQWIGRSEGRHER